MKPAFFRAGVLALALGLAALPARAGSILIEDAYLRTSGALARTAGAFMRIINTGPEDDRLVGLDSDIAARAETHTTIETGDGIMQMRRVEDGFVIPAGGEHLLARGGDHLMFMGLKRRLQDGDLVTVTLHFEKAGDVTIQIPVDLGRDRDMQMQGMTMPEGEDS